MAKSKKTSGKRERKNLNEDVTEAPKIKKKKQKAEVSEESDTEKPQVEPQDPSVMEELTPEERRVLERKLKKQRKKEEKKLKKSLAEETNQEPAKSSTAGELALQYLESWSKKCPEWKFQKSRQTWLLMNMYDSKKVSDKHFKKLLPYLEGLQGSARETTIKKAEEYMKEGDSGETAEESDEQRTNRIREVLQLLC